MFGPDSSLQVCLGNTEFNLDKRLNSSRFERGQYVETREAWMAGTGDLAGKAAGDTYGAEHLCRLLGE